MFFCGAHGADGEEVAEELGEALCAELGEEGFVLRGEGWD